MNTIHFFNPEVSRFIGVYKVSGNKYKNSHLKEQNVDNTNLKTPNLCPFSKIINEVFSNQMNHSSSLSLSSFFPLSY